MQDQKEETIDKVPILGDIPFLGELFKRPAGQEDQDRTLDLPHAARGHPAGALQGMSNDERRGTKLVPNAVLYPAAFEDTSRGLQRGAAESAPSSNVDEGLDRKGSRNRARARVCVR